jgi:hypothetical protein
METHLGLKPGNAGTLAVAYIAGALNATATTPMWTVVTRLKKQEKDAGGAKYSGVIGVCGCVCVCVCVCVSVCVCAYV